MLTDYIIDSSIKGGRAAKVQTDDDFDDGEDYSKSLTTKEHSTKTLLDFVKTGDGECSIKNEEEEECGKCSTKIVLDTIKSFTSNMKQAGGSSGEDYLIIAARILGIRGEKHIEYKILNHPDFVSYFVREHPELGKKYIETISYYRFKAEGPRETTELVSNFDIINILNRWQYEFPDFYSYGFAMIDFADTKSDLARIAPSNLIKGLKIVNDEKELEIKKFKTFACVINTDHSNGRGKHWVCIFGDCRNDKKWTIEFFNSSGNPPTSEIVEWMEYARDNLNKLNPGKVKTRVVSSIRHQNSRTECGIYSLYYIRSRLDGVSYKVLASARIKDEAMIEFRKHLFR